MFEPEAVRNYATLQAKSNRNYATFQSGTGSNYPRKKPAI
jgi:hypothetical protein